MDLIVMGSLVIDTTIVSNSIYPIGKYFQIKKGSKMDVDKLEYNFGGSAHNVAFGARKLGLKTGIIGAVGFDSFGTSIIRRLKKSGVDTRLLKKVATRMTGYSTVLIGPGGDRSILIYRGANNMIDPDDIKEIYFKNAKAFLFTTLKGKMSVNALKKCLRLAEKYRLTIIANPSISMIKKGGNDFERFVKKSTILIVNEEEALKLSGSTKTSTALDKLVVGKELVVVTRGEKGIIASDGLKTYKQSAFSTRIKDATGAGDAFTAGFVSCYLKGKPIPQCLKFGSATATMVLKEYGATNNYPKKSDIIRLMES
jgi:5-dehydro-2-deoxygluconokinase